MSDEDIQKLASEYYELVCQDHHKDRDCHWNIVKRWSYGGKPKYHVEHFGYVYDYEYSEDFSTHKEALNELERVLKAAIAMVKKDIAENGR